MNPARGQDAPHNRDPQADAASTLSALEDALRRALAVLPRDQVMKRVMTALPAEVLVSEDARLHGGKVRKVSVSMPEELADAVRARTGAAGFSRYVTEAVEERLRLDLMDEYAAELEVANGPVSPQELREAMREWPDYEE